MAALPSIVVPMAAQAKEKGYMTMDEYNRMIAKQRKDEELYGYFATLRSRAAQTGEFETLAAKGDFSGVTKLALAWDSTIRQDVLDRAAKELTGADQKAANSLSKSVLDESTSLADCLNLEDALQRFDLDKDDKLDEREQTALYRTYVYE